MKNRIAIAISIAVLALAGTVFAAKGQEALSGMNNAMTPEAFLLDVSEGKHPFARRIMAHIAERLGLTDSQKTEIKAILVAERPNFEPLVRQLATTRQQMRATTKDGNFDEAQVRSLASQQSQTITELIVVKERVKSKIYDVLTPEQRAKAEKMRERFASRMREGILSRLNEQAEK